MLDIAPTELLLVAVVALLVIGPKDLPRVMRHVGRWVGKARGVARHFRSGFDQMVREAELEEMEKRWKSENDRIMREHPMDGSAPAPAIPGPTSEFDYGAPPEATAETGPAAPAAPAESEAQPVTPSRSGPPLP
ncbi:Sec-independent protein translocase protein TatB [Sphingomonas quercus]|uniref:Sec-independent protein translocase protein TatB n=1 Tax=Sphingomonas quercus TaxID=2842451 RepID=A0ABS6BJH4_9SPHN|nr:Sec-independent protein translocase protein TatB [Sphingomonas quercus]MBU3078451.1 Sec-independent protein translocase protein TatB [Sphingomonas quercus]